jgi:Domain of unknown function (DUF4396)
MDHTLQKDIQEKEISGDVNGDEAHVSHIGHELGNTGTTDHDHSHLDHSQMDHSKMGHAEHNGHEASHHHAPDTVKDIEANHSHRRHKMGEGLPNWAIILIGVSHCGAGCVLGDLVGEWVVWGSGITINGRDTWPCLLLDYGFALLFGIFFQYGSIAPMSGEYGLPTLWRAAKADILSLTFFEIGLFGWMVIFQVAIWPDLEMTTWLYW